ncbi:MAG: aminopeptidase P N-terminal domain-containing protein, partial [Candidatus Thermoplasmatota archaeon]|nr:aminopeptidase P N-terminal domain-containing protein [Candidatus Thermoplasmatota archaeon]
DVEYPYRTSSDLIYLTGWTEAESVFVMRYENNGWVSALFVQPKDTLKEIWEGRRPGVEGATADYAVHEAYNNHEIEDRLDVWLNDARRVFHRGGINPELDRLVETAVRRRDRARQHFGTGPVAVEDPSSLLAELRLRKSSSEIEQMVFASKVASIAHELAMRHSREGVTEYQLQSIIEGFFSYAGASGWSYPSIVGCGENATILHYTTNQDVCGEDEVILIDAGAEFRGYASDITRSWPISGRFTDPQREIYQIVLDAQLAAIDACQVGNLYTDPHDAARTVLAEGLIRLGVISQSLDEALDLETGDLRKWYMHNTSHWIGLDVHDAGVYKPGGTPRVLEPGMCLTIEPGLYFGAWRPDVDCPERYANIGIRIEDDVLITTDGPVVLTADCPKSIDDIENIVGQDLA